MRRNEEENYEEYSNNNDNNDNDNNNDNNDNNDNNYMYQILMAYLMGMLQSQTHYMQ